MEQQMPCVLLVGFGLRRVFADDVQRTELAALHRCEHIGQIPSALSRQSTAPRALELRNALRILDVLAARKLIRDCAHVAAALDVVLSAQRIEARTVPSDVPA